MIINTSTKKKVLTLIGSNNIDSESRVIFKHILKEIDFNENYDYKEISLENYYLSYCNGCKDCFKKGYCYLDKNDGMYVIRRELEKADIVFFVVPVYAHNVPGKIKTMIDRLSYEFHLMNLCGKIGFSIVITDISGSERVSEYIYDIFTNLGIKQIGSYTYKHCINYKDDDINVFKNIGDSIKEKINKNKDFTNDDLEYFYKYYKDTYNSNNVNIFDNVEKFWNSAEVKLTDSFQEFCQTKKLK